MEETLQSAQQRLQNYQLGDGLKATVRVAKTKVAQAKEGAKNSMVEGLKKRIIDTFRRVYLEKAKPMLTQGDKHMPMAVRRAIHDVADSFWWSLMQELPRTIDSLFDVVQEAHRERRRLARYQPMLVLGVLVVLRCKPIQLACNQLQQLPPRAP